MSGTPELVALYRAAAEDAISHVCVSTPGIVQSYDAATKTCTVQPAVKRPLFTQSGAVVYEDFAPVQNVPVCFEGGASFSQTFTLAKGDSVLLVFQDFSIAGWRARGEVSEPGDVRHHGPGYPVAVPFYRPAGGPGENDPGDSMGKPGGLRLHFQTGHIGAGGQSDFVAMAAKVDLALSQLNAILTTLAGTLAGATVEAACATAGTALGTALGAWPAGSVASTNLKAD